MISPGVRRNQGPRSGRRRMGAWQTAENELVTAGMSLRSEKGCLGTVPWPRRPL
jgi:hypothetical protein